MTAKQRKNGFPAVHVPSARFGVDFANIRGLHSNLSAVHHHLETARPAMLFLTETQIVRPPDLSYLDYPGFALEESFLRKAGVCLYVRSDICCRRLRCLEDPKFSTMWVHVDLGCQSRVYMCLYRSHTDDSVTAQLFEYLSRATDAAQERFPDAELVFLGDFNAHHQQWLGSRSPTNIAGRAVHDFALSFGLTQLVSQATRIPDTVDGEPSLLDLLLTNRPAGYVVEVSAPLGSSDHCLVSTSVPRSSPPQHSRVRRRLWHYSSADWDGMREYFASIPWGQRCFRDSNASACAAAVAAEIGLGMEYYIPSSMISCDGRRRPWFDRDCLDAVAFKRSAYRTWVRAKTSDPGAESLKKAYNRASKSCKKVLHRAKSKRITRVGEELLSHPTGSRGFWRLASAVESNFCRSTLPPLERPNGTLAFSAREKADLLASIFAENSRLEDGGAMPPSVPHCGHDMPEVVFRQRHVRRELLSLDVRKASGPDGVPARVLRYCAAELSPVLTRLFRLSYMQGHVPAAWRAANVQPVPKKGDRSDPGNYRPIAITSMLCKVMERIINSQMVRYLEDHSLIHDRQYGFRPNRSAGDLLGYVTHLWGEAMDRFGESLAISLDISKAFDRVWHKGLLSKLPAYGLPDRLCNWLASFLHRRSITVIVDGYASESMQVNAGVPQGSVLSPTLFVLHINDMLSLGNIHCYADDSTVHGRYIERPSAGPEAVGRMRASLVAELDETLLRVSEWGAKNLVQFNARKTQVCAFSSKKSSFLPVPTLQNVPLPISGSLSLLGMEVCAGLSHTSHIAAVTSTASRKLGVLNKVRAYFTPAQRLLLYKAQIRSCVEYCSHLWDGSARYVLDGLDSLQRRAVRIVGDEVVARSLEPLQMRRDIASLSALYRYCHGECSEELHALIPPAPHRSRSTRAGDRMHQLSLQPITARTKKYGQSFLCRSIEKWNDLPKHIFPPSYNPGSFKRSVKRHFSKPA